MICFLALSFLSLISILKWIQWKRRYKNVIHLLNLYEMKIDVLERRNRRRY